MILVMSSLMGMSVMTFTSIWVMLEMNTIAMCFIMSKLNKINKMNNENTMKYFLVQALASALVMLMVTSNKSSNFWEMGMTVMLMIKMGVWPSHLWYMKMLNSMDMKSESMLIVMTWQKVMPLVLMNNMSLSEKTKTMMVLVSLMSMLIPITQLKKMMEKKMVMAMSSINTNGWLLMLTMLEKLKMIVFIMVYTPSLNSALKELSKKENNEKKLMKKSMSTTMKMANLSGMPPLPLFWGKLILIMSLIENNIHSLVMILMLMIACGMAFFYTHVSLPSLLSTKKKNNI